MSQTIVNSLLSSLITTLISQVHRNEVNTGSLISVAGWVRTRRDSKRVSFIELNDGTCSDSLQIVIDATKPELIQAIQAVTTGASLKVQGELVKSTGKGQLYEMQAHSLEVLGLAPPEAYPLQKKDMTLEYLREVAHLRVRTASFSSIFRIRSALAFAIHRFFQLHEFSYVHTPILTTSDGEGAGESFDLRDQEFFGEKAMLCVTGQLEAELLAMGLNRVYTFGPTFRAENSNTSRHLAEFWMMEPEWCFANLQDLMAMCELFLQTIAKEIQIQCAKDIEICAARAETDPHATLNMLQQSYARISYRDAIKVLQNSHHEFEFPVTGFGMDLKSEHERFLCEVHFQSPVMVYNYPEQLKAFYMYANDDGTVQGVDVLVPGIGEMIGGSVREHRETELFARLQNKGIDSSHMGWYLDSRRFGSVPHVGFGLGFERLMMAVTGLSNIRDVIPFARTPGQCQF